MPLTPKSPARILAIGAHPDDIEFGCGGVLLAEAARGNKISLYVCSRGEAGVERHARRAQSGSAQCRGRHRRHADLSRSRG